MRSYEKAVLPARANLSRACQEEYGNSTTLSSPLAGRPPSPLSCCEAGQSSSYPSKPHRSAAEETTNTTPLPADGQADATLAEAFHDLHGSRLHGFALLVSLGNTRRAEQAAAEALAAGRRQASGLRHPERAAAWLRARVLRSLRHGMHASVGDAAQWTALASLGVEQPVYDGLAALSIEGRAALVASVIERFEAIDVETILGASPSVTRRLVGQARTGYLTAISNRPSGQTGDARGPLATRVRDVASRALTAEVFR